MLLLQHKLKKSAKYQYAILETIWRLIFTLQLSPMRSAFKVVTTLVVQNRKRLKRGLKVLKCISVETNPPQSPSPRSYP